MTFGVQFQVKSVAIIGAGPSGLAALYELLHTSREGTSSVGGASSESPAFEEVVVFEQKNKSGGIWAPYYDDPGYLLPPQDLLETSQYNNPDVIHPKVKPPKGIDEATFEKPIEVEVADREQKLQWAASGVYADLFTNIPSRFMRFSYLPNPHNSKENKIYPFITNQEVESRLNNFINENDLEKHIRLNSHVDSVEKLGQKWVVTVKETGGRKAKWYRQSFDAVIVANGHYTVPYIPKTPGLAEFNKVHPGSIIHSKAYRDPSIFDGKKVLFVGGSITSLDLVKYAFPRASQVTISKRGPHLVFPYINAASESQGIVTKPTIDRFDASSKSVTYSDGTKGEYDLIILATGYHYHYPFLRDALKVIDPSNLSRVKGLYLDVFSMKDPTLAALSVSVTPLNFHAIESEAMAIAGVWSNAKALPSIEDQYKWENKRVEATADSLFFHYYDHEHLVPDLVDKLFELAPKKRQHPLQEDGKFLSEIDEAYAYQELLFYQFKHGYLNSDDMQESLSKLSLSLQ
ncbi:hypothetical protein LJB42_002413 [Komagataella kurtzmanii]|nr:hypothetical protein LJB42_002413 [Komagataella kurtzmanii]